MEIRAAGPGQEPVSVAVTMRTPGADMELAAGFLFTEGLVESAGEIATMRYCGLEEPAEQRFNIVTVELRRPFDPGRLERNFYATSSCGICGKASIDQVEVRTEPVAPGPLVEPGLIEGLPLALREGQELFDATGGLHAAGLFDADGALLALREDVGRHNAMDKLVGHELLEGACRRPVGSCWFPAGRASSSSRRPRSRGSRSSARSRRRRRSRSRPRGGSASRSSRSCADVASTSTRTQSGSRSRRTGRYPPARAGRPALALALAPPRSRRAC